MASLTVENYCKAILQLSGQTEEGFVSTGLLAEQMDVSPGTVTSMLKTLAESNLVDYRPYEGVSLTRSGKSLALRMLRRHRLIELFLVRTLELSWDEVHEEAEHMEHAVSDALIDRIDEYLGHPEYDPHGDPIPSSNGKLRGDAADFYSLTKTSVGESIRVTRVLNQNAEFLRFLSDEKIAIGDVFAIQNVSQQAGIVTLKKGTALIPIGWSVAEQILVEKVGVS